MTERMVEALEIEGKHHEVHWYDDEGHGWEKRENRRDAFGRILAFLKKHVLDEAGDGPLPSGCRSALGALPPPLGRFGMTLIAPFVSRTAQRARPRAPRRRWHGASRRGPRDRPSLQ